MESHVVSQVLQGVCDKRSVFPKLEVLSCDPMSSFNLSGISDYCSVLGYTSRIAKGIRQKRQPRGGVSAVTENCALAVTTRAIMPRRRSDPRCLDLAVEFALEDQSSPPRKQRKKQNSPTSREPSADDVDLTLSPIARIVNTKHREQQWSVPGYLAPRQKTFYARVAEVCSRVYTQPLPVRVSSVTGHGEFFNVGDPIPKQAKLVVEGMEDPLVRGLRLERLCSAALSERARRRNEQMKHAVQAALWNEGTSTGERATEWWTHLCANKHLRENPNLKRVRDGEPLGSVADGVEWALLEMLRTPEDGELGPSGAVAASASKDVSLLIGVARKWASCLTWSRVTHGSWSYQGITTRMLKEGVPQVDVVVNIGRSAALRDEVMSGKVSAARLRRGDKWESHSRREDSAAITSSHRDGVGVLLWRPGARDVGANLATVFAKEGRKEATLQAAVSASQRAEMLSRCHLLLRRALHDLIEGKASMDMVRGVSSTAVGSEFLKWLQKSVARNVSGSWSRSDEAVSQVMECIALSIEREGRVSDAVTSWSKAHGSAQILGFPIPIFHASGVTEADFNALKRVEGLRRQEADSIAVMVYHTLYLVLPCQPIKFHFAWGRFMRFCYGMSLYQHIARYYTEFVRTESRVGGGGRGMTSSANFAQRRETSTTEAARASLLAAQDLGGKISWDASKRDYPQPRLYQQCKVEGNSKSSELEFRPSYRHGAWLTPREGHDGAALGTKTGQGVTSSSLPRARAEEAEQSTVDRMEAAVANECLVSLLASHGTANRLVTGAQIAAALRREGLPDAEEALALLKDPSALRGRGVRNRLWRGRRGAVLLRVRDRTCVFSRLPPELFRNMLQFLAS